MRYRTVSTPGGNSLLSTGATSRGKGCVRNSRLGPGTRVASSTVPTALVTGGAGFLGSHLCDYLLEKGYRVLCVDNLDTSSLANIEHIRDERFGFLYHDMVEHLEVAEPIDFVYHLASPASPIDYLRLPLHTLKVGSYGTHNALGLAKFKRPRLLLAESGEHMPVNIGNPNEFTLIDLAEKVLKITGSSSEIVFEALPIDDPQQRQPDITRAKQVLGWEPQIELEEGLRRMIAALGREPVRV